MGGRRMKITIDNLEIAAEDKATVTLNIIPEYIDDETEKDWTTLSKSEVLELISVLLNSYKEMED